MADAAPRISSALLAAIERLDDERLPIAEVHRRVATVAELIGCSRPSYEQVRILVHEHRRRGLAPTAGEILLSVASRGRPPAALLDLLEGA
ncbi:MAG: hypothetical protein HOQ03_03910 [Thermoleophilia bacterium]|nr:hypothetical protein [Thermoleophilia bacterium]